MVPSSPLCKYKNKTHSSYRAREQGWSWLSGKKAASSWDQNTAPRSPQADMLKEEEELTQWEVDGTDPGKQPVWWKGPMREDKINADTWSARNCSWEKCRFWADITLFLYQLLGFKETLEMSHLPNSNDYKNESLDYGPPENPLVCAFTGLPETLFPPLRKEGKYYWNNIKIQWDIFLWTVWGKQQNIENCAYLHLMTIRYVGWPISLWYFPQRVRPLPQL